MKARFKIFKSNKTPLKRGEQQKDLNEKKVCLPANHALHDFLDVDRKMLVEGQKVVGEINMYKGVCHRITPQYPTPVRDEVLIDCTRIRKISGSKPSDGHTRKAIGGKGARMVVNRQRDNDQGAKHASKTVQFPKLFMDLRVLFPRFGVNQIRSAYNGRYSCCYMQQEKNIVQNKPFFKEKGSERNVCIEFAFGKIASCFKQNQTGRDSNIFQIPRHAPEAFKYQSRFLENMIKPALLTVNNFKQSIHAGEYSTLLNSCIYSWDCEKERIPCS